MRVEKILNPFTKNKSIMTLYLLCLFLNLYKKCVLLCVFIY